VLLGIEEFELENLLHLQSKKIECIKDQRIVYIGQLPMVHGHELGLRSTGSYASPARILFMRTKHSCLCSHLHQSSSHNEPTIDDRLISTWSTGHLSDPHPLYARINKWNWGCARIEVDDEGHFEVINLRLIDNKLYRS
jgi:hypothetical protein